MIFVIEKHIEYNYYDYAFIRTTVAQNTTIALSVMPIKGSHLWFYINVMVMFKIIVRNAFITHKYPRIKVLLMIIAPQD